MTRHPMFSRLFSCAGIALFFSNPLIAQVANPCLTTETIALERDAFPVAVSAINELAKFRFARPKRVCGLVVTLASSTVNGATAVVRLEGKKLGEVFVSSAPSDTKFEFPGEIRGTMATRLEIETVGVGRELPKAMRILQVLARVAIEEPDSTSSQEFRFPAASASELRSLKFPCYFRTVMGNVSNQAIVLVNEMVGFTSYREMGTYLLPIKKASFLARAVAEARGDASGYARPYFIALLKTLDDAEPYFTESLEKGRVEQLAAELLGLREHVRKILH